MAYTLKELAFTEISHLLHSPGSVFDPGDFISKALGYMKETGRREVVASKANKVGILDVRTLLDVDQPHSTKIERKWDQLGNVSQGDRVLKAVKVLHGRNIWALPVTKDNEVIGVIGHEDVLDALCEVIELETIKAKEIAKNPVMTINEGKGIAHARRLMLDNDFSQIPVIDEGRLVGMITAEDIVHTFITTMSKTTRGNRSGDKRSRFQGQVKAIMDSQPHIVDQDADLKQVVQGLRDLDKSVTVILNDEREVQGIITKSDILSLILRVEEPKELPVFILGITDEDFFEKAVAEEKIRRIVKKSLRIHPNIINVMVRVKKQRIQGERAYYELTARAYGPNSQFNANNKGWDLMETFDGLCDALSKSLRRAKKEPQKGVRRGRRRPNPHLKS
ncbi:MAG: CBS domain-containing protein [Candidatus Thorarchaeota archaeon]